MQVFSGSCCVNLWHNKKTLTLLCKVFFYAGFFWLLLGKIYGSFKPSIPFYFSLANFHHLGNRCFFFVGIFVCSQSGGYYP